MVKRDNKILEGYFFTLFSLIPASIILGPAISLFNILLIDFSFLLLLIFTKEYKFLSNKTVKIILILYLYLIFNSIVSENFALGALRNFGFIRFIILFFAFNYFFYYKNYFNKILIIWSLTLFIVLIDVYIENFTGENILGYGNLYGNRIISFFKDEPIVGGYISAFYLITIGYFFSFNHKFSDNYKHLVLLVSVFFLAAIFLTGERSNATKALFGFMLFYFINNHFSIKEKLIAALLVLVLLSYTIYNSNYLKQRYIHQVVEKISLIYQSGVKKEISNDLQAGTRSIYFELYRSGFLVFKDYPFFGAGNKNYRHVACTKNQKPNYVCNTHPHQTYFEFLAEHGLLGTIVLLFILYNLVFWRLKIILQSKNYIQIGCFIFLSSSFIPFLPSGAFFGDYSFTIFWINLSLMYSVNKKTNIFLKINS